MLLLFRHRRCGRLSKAKRVLRCALEHSVSLTFLATHDFLTDDWIAAAEEIYAAFADRVDLPAQEVRINVIVTAGPFPDGGEMRGSIDSRSGDLLPRRGHLDDPELTVKIPYETAKAVFVKQDIEVVMISFMSGEIEIEGDITVLLDLQDVNPTPAQEATAREVADQLLAITN